jgi:hypothetical protein
MDFDFPEPYDLEVPRRIGEARQELSPEGEEVLERILAQEGSPLGCGIGTEVAACIRKSCAISFNGPFN